jgi:hypothetical protein
MERVGIHGLKIFGVLEVAGIAVGLGVLAMQV